MKKLIFFACVVAVFSVSVLAGRIIFNTPLVSESGLSYSNTYTLNTASFTAPGGAIDLMSAELVVSSVTYSTLSLADGRASTGTLTVGTLTSLSSAAASAFFTVKSTTGLTNQFLTFNGNVLREGFDWFRLGTTSDTAVSIKSALNNFNEIVASTGGNSTVYTTSTISGYFANVYTLSSSTPTAISVNSSTFTGGRDAASVSIAGNWIKNGVDWFAASTASGTAKSISDAFMANSIVSGLVTSTWTAGGVVSATSTILGPQANYSMRSTDLVDISTSNGGFMVGGATSSVNTSIGGLTSVGHPFTAGLQVLYKLTSGTSPANLVTNTTYYVIPVDANNFKLATTLARSTAVPPVAINVSTQVTTGGSAFTLAPLALTGSPSAKWEFSNDNMNWINVNTSSVSSSVMVSTVTAWDFSWANYHYYRFNITGPASGALNVQLTINGKSLN